jgi:hypothetical protein
MRNIPLAFALTILCLAGCLSSGETDRDSGPDGSAPPPHALTFTGTWATDGRGAGGIREMTQQGSRLTGAFDRGRGRYAGNVSGRKVSGRFWWNRADSGVDTFEKTPVENRGYFEIELAEDGNSFSGRTRFEKGVWVPWVGARVDPDTVEPPAPPAEVPDFSGKWVTDGSGAFGIRTFYQRGPEMIGHFDDYRGRYAGEVDGRFLRGRFWWNEKDSGISTFENTPPAQRGRFEVELSEDGEVFSGRTRFEEDEWVSWNGYRVEEFNVYADPEKDFTGTWTTDGTGAGGVRRIVQDGYRLWGNFDRERGRYEGTVLGRSARGRFWWNRGDSGVETFAKTPVENRGYFEIELDEDGNSFSGRSRYENGAWKTWNGARASNEYAEPALRPETTFSGKWATDGRGAFGIRTLLQEGDRVTGHYDDFQGRYGGEVKGRKLTGRFWWNAKGTGVTTFEKTPPSQRGNFEVELSDDGGRFHGRTRFEGGDWVPWNGSRIEEFNIWAAATDFTGIWVVDNDDVRRGAWDGEMVLSQDAVNRLTGRYAGGQWRIEGRVEGKKFTGRWWWNSEGDTAFDECDPRYRGEMEWVLSEDGGSFIGQCLYPDGQWRFWNGKRK